MKYYASIIILFFSLLVGSCCKPIIDRRVFVNNTTNEKIEIKRYATSSTKSVLIESNSKVSDSLDLLNNRDNDSVQVFVKGILTETHYSNKITKVTADSTKILKFANPKNIFNANNYTTKVEQLSCGGSSTEKVYSF